MRNNIRIKWNKIIKCINNKVSSNINFCIIFFIIFGIVAILFTGAGCFYRAITNDILNVINNKFREVVINLLKQADWRKIVNNMTSVEKINQWQVYKYIKDNIPEVE